MPVVPSLDSIGGPFIEQVFNHGSLVLDDINNPHGPFTPALHAGHLDFGLTHKVDPVPRRSLSFCVAPQAKVPPSTCQKLQELHDIGQDDSCETKLTFRVAYKASVPPPAACTQRAVSSQNSCETRYEETAAQVLPFGPEALRLLREPSASQHEPNLRHRVRSSWSRWPRHEQSAVFSSRPWAHFVWLALGAIAQRLIAPSRFDRGHDDDVFRQVKACFVVGGGPGLAAYLDYEKTFKRTRYLRLRESVLAHPVIVDLARRWHDEGVLLDKSSFWFCTRGDGRS